MESPVITAWLTGMATPLILMLMGEPKDRKMSEAFFSAISVKTRCIADIESLPGTAVAASLIPSEQFVEAGFGPRFRVDLFYNHRAIKDVFAVRGGQITGNHPRSGRYPAIADLAGGPVEDFRALAEKHAHGDDAVLLDDHAFHDLRARADEAVVFDDH